jgi:hypothetical protein
MPHIGKYLRPPFGDLEITKVLSEYHDKFRRFAGMKMLGAGRRRMTPGRGRGGPEEGGREEGREEMGGAGRDDDDDGVSVL